MCCIRKKANPKTLEESKKIFDAESQITTFQQLIESLEIKPVGIQELIDKKNALLSVPEWGNPNKNNLAKLKQSSTELMTTMVGQIRDMSRALKTLILINTQLEEKISDQKNARKPTVKQILK